MTQIVPDKIIILNNEANVAETICKISLDRISRIRSGDNTAPSPVIKTLPMTTFIDLAVQGKIANPLKEIHEHIAAWHKSDLAPALHKWLGMTWDEYKAFVENSSSLHATIASRTKTTLADTVPMGTIVEVYLPITFGEHHLIRLSEYKKLPHMLGQWIYPTTVEADAKSRTIKTSNIGFMAKLYVSRAFMSTYNLYLDRYNIPISHIDRVNENLLGRIELITVS